MNSSNVRPLRGHSVLSFDCYGTLIDWETGIWTALQPLVGAKDLDRDAVLSLYAGIEAEAEAQAPTVPYRLLLRTIHARLATRLDLETNAGMDERFGASVARWPSFEDSTAALKRLGQHFSLVILSNVDRESFAGSQATLGVEFDAVYTADDIGSYKPSPANFEYLLDGVATDFGAGSDGVLHVAQSLFHDHVPAKDLGLTTAWIDRQRLSQGGSWGATAVVSDPPEPDYTFFTLSEMADAVDGQ